MACPAIRSAGASKLNPLSRLKRLTPEHSQLARVVDGMTYDFLIDTYETERLKVLSAWSMFRDEDLKIRPHATDQRGRNAREHMVHQCVGENLWFKNMLGIDVDAPPLPDDDDETRLGFIERYATDSNKRLEELKGREDAWWQVVVSFFDTQRSRAWIMARRIAHTAHHRGQQTTLLRILNRDLHSTYGPTADTGGLMQQEAPVIYAYRDADALLAGERAGGRKTALPPPPNHAVTERG